MIHAPAHRQSRTCTTSRPAACLVSLCLCMISLIALVGCSSYTIDGRVIRGPIPTIERVSSSDARLTETNATGAGASISAVLEPETPTERVDLGSHLADDQGYFSIPVDALGAGLLEYEIQVLARRKGNQHAVRTLAMPGPGERLLITLPLGEDNYKAPGRFLDRALREAEPYLRESR